MDIAIFGKLTEKTDLNGVAAFFAFLRYRNIGFAVYEPYWQELAPRLPAEWRTAQIAIFTTPEQIAHFRCVYSFGGDGTVLEAVRFVGAMRKPILGVNFGRLGYLTSITQAEVISATDELMRDMYRIDERTLLEVTSERVPQLFGAWNVGVNDVTIHKSNRNEMITVHTYLNGEFLNTYWGDGLIIATPTGSTAYSLSCGGPIIFPSANSFVITPVAPHSLTVRPVVIPDDSVISCEIHTRSGSAMVGLDTRTELIENGTLLAIRRAPFKARLIRLYSSNYITNLRSLLKWGSDIRN